MKPNRRYSGYLKNFSGTPFGPSRMGCSSIDIKSELFASIEYFSEIEEVGRTFLIERGNSKNIKKTFKQFQAFIRQAKTFYESAELLHYRASPLTYYYSFLNLAKAYLTIFDADSMSGITPVYHGIKHIHQNRALREQVIEVDGGVFPKFYRQISGQAIRRTSKLNLVQLLGYCTDITDEYETGEFGTKRRTPGGLIVGIHENDAFPIVTIANFEDFKPYKKSLKKFHDYFEMIEFDKQSAKDIFGLNGEVFRHFHFFESKGIYSIDENDKIPTDTILPDVYSAMDLFFEESVYVPHFNLNFELNLPFQLNNQKPMKEVLAIYVVMFFLGSLVRYRPDYLEAIYESKDSWLIQSFVRSAPLTFLKRMSNLISGRYRIYYTR